jgi:hypothetical protein
LFQLRPSSHGTDDGTVIPQLKVFDENLTKSEGIYFKRVGKSFEIFLALAKIHQTVLNPIQSMTSFESRQISYNSPATQTTNSNKVVSPLFTPNLTPHSSNQTHQYSQNARKHLMSKGYSNPKMK